MTFDADSLTLDVNYSATGNIFNDKSIFEGAFENGKSSNVGKITTNNGEVYEGEL